MSGSILRRKAMSGSIVRVPSRQPLPSLGGERRTLLVLLLLFAVGGPRLQAQLLINELMQSNVDGIMDDYNDFPDSWVELYNAGKDTLDLRRYRLCSSLDVGKAWRFPRQPVAPKSYVLVYCDKVGKGLHANFRLETDKGCNVILFRDSVVVDFVANLPKQPAPNIAYGRRGDGRDEWGYLLRPTPGETNARRLAKGVLQNPEFSTPGRVSTGSEAIELQLSVPDGSPARTVVRYTTDGSEPTEESTPYKDPITITSNTQVRARLFCEDYLSPPSVCHSYLFFRRPLQLPVISLVTDDKYLSDPYIGIYTTGSYQDGKPNYQFDWRRPVNMELFETGGGESVINQLCETRIFGGTSRDHEPRSMVLYAHKRFGTKHFTYEFFPDQRPGISKYKSIALRNAGQDCDGLYMRDAVIQRTMAMHTDIDWQAWRPAIVYVNGSYWGMLNIRDRSNEDNIYSYYDGLEDIDLVENLKWVKEGTPDHFNAFQAFYSEEGHTMAEYEEWMDCEEFINVMAMNMYYVNYDFPGTNNMMWRPRTDGGRWRWIAKDVDHGMGLYRLGPDYNYVEWINNNDYDPSRNWSNKPEHTLLFRHLMDDADFNREFIDHIAVYMGDFLNERGTRAVWDSMYEEVKAELPYVRRRFGLGWSYYDTEMEKAREWLEQRAAYAYRQLADYYQLGTPTPLRVKGNGNLNLNLNDNLNGDVKEIRMNGISITGSYFDGMFFAGRTLTVSATAAEGKAVKGWSIEETGADGTVRRETVAGAEHTFTMPECKALALEAITGEDVGISEAVSRDKRPGTQTVYNLMGIRMERARKGVNIVGGKKMLE